MNACIIEFYNAVEDMVGVISLTKLYCPISWLSSLS